MTVVTIDTPGAWTWVSTFTGLGSILQWGAGQSGASGQAITKGGKGGDAGYLCIDIQYFVTGVTYSGYNGIGGATVPWAGGSGHPGNPGGSSYFGAGTTCRAPGGGSTDTPLGRAKIPGGLGDTPAGGNWSGGKGGDSPSSGDYHGAAGAPSNGQNAGIAGTIPGAGGSGGGQSSSGDGGAGGPGRTIIYSIPESTTPGQYLVGLDENYAFSAVGVYDDFVAPADGIPIFEGVGSGGGGRGGNGLALQGGHSGSGGAWMWRARQVFKDVSYRRTVPAGGAGTNLNGGAAGNGADAEWTLTPLRIVQKQIASNVATLWTCEPGSSTPKKHGFLVGESVIVAGVDATFNGTFTVTAVASDRLSFSYAKTAANSGPTAVTPTGTSAGLANPFLRAKGGLGGTGIYTGGTPVAGGSAAAGIGDGGEDGDRGQVVGSATTTAGANAGGGALPLGEQGGWGGGSTLSTSGTNAGDPGLVPGGGGGGGRGQTGGNGGAGARGAAVVRYVLELGAIWDGGERRSIMRRKVWQGGSGISISRRGLWVGSVYRSLLRILVHPESKKRRFPSYLPTNYQPFFDRTTGTFNWRDGVALKIRDPMYVTGDFDFVAFGDSVLEGWTSFDGLLTGTKDFPKAFPRFARDYLTTLVPGLAKGGTGAIRTNTVSGVDPQWSISGWSASGDKHYVNSSNTGHIATFTPGMDSGGANGGTPQQITGNKIAVVYSGGGITVKDSGGTVLGTGPATAGLGTLARLEITMGTTAGHVVKINPTAAVSTNLYTCDVYKTGIRVHNLAQGGAKAGGGTGQSYWGPASGMTAPGNMTACYTQSVMVPASKGQPECYLIFLGGNDSNAGTNAADIKAAFKRIIDMIQAAAPNAAIVLMPDVWTSDRNLALLDLCREEGVAMIDFFYISRALTSIFGKNYNGDNFGHLNSTTGAPWAGGMVRDAFVYNPF